MSPRPSLHELLNTQPPLDADRVRISNVRVSPKGDVKDTWHNKINEVTFDIGWKESWRYDEGEKAGNRDAVWIFAKGKTKSSIRLPPDWKGKVIDALNQARLKDAVDRLIALVTAPSQSSGYTSSFAEYCKLIHAVCQHGKSESACRVVRKDELWVTSVKFEFWPRPLEFVFKLHPKNEGRESESEVLEVFSPYDEHLSLPLHPGARHTPHVSGAPEAEFLFGKGHFPMGVLLCRKHPASPSRVSFKDVKLSFACNQDTESIKLFAIEMVRIPEGAFRLGDPTGEELTACFYDARKRAGNAKEVTYEVTSEKEIKLGEELGFDPYNEYAGTNVDLEALGVIPREFPKGFNAFYMMKYQVSQDEYAAFINQLRGAGRTLRYPFAEDSYRFSIQMDAKKKRIALRPHRPCNWLSWADGLLFADWAGLRPMTELEYEKACRGFRAPVHGEFAWGAAEPEQARIILGDESQGSEIVSGNCNYDRAVLKGGDGGQGPVREDAFVSSDVLQRFLPQGAEVPSQENPDVLAATGASYWGVYGLSGNLWEFCVTVASPEGLKFKEWDSGGELVGEMFGQAGEMLGRGTGPGMEGKGAGFRGGSWFTPKERLCIADRRYAGGIPGYMGRTHDTGFRAVLTDPEYMLSGEGPKPTKRPARKKKRTP